MGETGWPCRRLEMVPSSRDSLYSEPWFLYTQDLRSTMVLTLTCDLLQQRWQPGLLREDVGQCCLHPFFSCSQVVVQGELSSDRVNVDEEDQQLLRAVVLAGSLAWGLNHWQQLVKHNSHGWIAKALKQKQGQEETSAFHKDRTLVQRGLWNPYGTHWPQSFRSVFINPDENIARSLALEILFWKTFDKMTSKVAGPLIMILLWFERMRWKFFENKM